MSCHRPITLQKLRQQVLHLQWDLPISAGPGLRRSLILHCHRDHAGELGQAACQRPAEPHGEKAVRVLGAGVPVCAQEGALPLTFSDFMQTQPVCPCLAPERWLLLVIREGHPLSSSLWFPKPLLFETEGQEEWETAGSPPLCVLWY